MIRGEIWWADYGVPFGSEPGYRRPVVIMQTDRFTRSALNTVLVVPLTTNMLLADAPGNVFLEKSATALAKDSVAVVAHLSALDKRRLSDCTGRLPFSDLQEIEDGIRLILGL